MKMYGSEKSEFPALEKCLPYFSNPDIEENRYCTITAALLMLSLFFPRCLYKKVYAGFSDSSGGAGLVCFLKPTEWRRSPAANF
jgi:hypothetical protein